MRLSLPYIGSWPRAARRPGGAPAGALLLALLYVLAMPLLWLSLTAVPTIHIEVGEWGDDPYLTGVNQPEANATETYRWTGERSALTLPNLGARYGLLRLRAHGWRPPGNPSPKVRVAVAGQMLAVIQTTPALHTYNILLPPDVAGPDLTVDFTSDLYRDAADRRDIGFAIDWVELSRVDQGAGPAAWQLGGQALLLALAFGLLLALGLPRGWAAGAAVALALALLGANTWQPLWVGAALPAWLIVAAALLAATLLLQPAFGRALAPWMAAPQARVAWALFVAALGLRLLGATHPLFEIHDFGFHRNWITDVSRGQLYIYSTPSEFQNRPVFNPPAGYLLLVPLRLIGLPTKLTIQAGLALFDALGALLLLPLARELGLGARAALLALALYAALPINMTMMWWGFTTNALAQTVGLALIWALLRMARRPTAGRQATFAAACGAGLLTHIGALVMIVALLGAWVLLGWRRLTPDARRAAIVIGLLTGLAAALIYFSAVVNSSLAQRPADSGQLDPAALLARGWAIRGEKLGLIWLGLLRGFLPLPLALAPLALAWLLGIRPRQPFARALVISWLGICLLFFGIYMGLGLVVRFLYFAAPLLCLGWGALLSGLWPRRGRAVVIALVLLVAWAGVALWAAGVLLGVKPSGVPLTY